MRLLTWGYSHLIALKNANSVQTYLHHSVITTQNHNHKNGMAAKTRSILQQEVNIETDN